jgi:hypothetical protein
MNGVDTKDVDSFFKLTIDTTKNTVYTINNWYYFYNDIHDHGTKKYFLDAGNPLAMIYDKKGAMWLNANGDVCYRFSTDAEIHTTTLEKACRVISNFLHCNVQIWKNRKSIKSKRASQDVIDKIYEEIEQNSIFRISIHDLLLVEDETFNFSHQDEFYQASNGLIYRNTFKPSVYLLQLLSADSKFEYSIILQYIFYLSGYNQSRFHVILNWLANYFKNFNFKTYIPLVLIGDKKSGVDILFDQIIKPLFGHESCVALTDNHLHPKTLSAILKNKLMYHLDDISDNINHNSESKKILTEMILKRKVYLKNNRGADDEIDIFGQILITLSKPNIPYLDKEKIDFIAFKVPDDFEQQMLIPDRFSSEISSCNVNKRDILQRLISGDLTNFAYILKSHTIKESSIDDFAKNGADDKNLILQSIDDKLKAFSDAIINIDLTYFEKIQNIAPDLYNEIMQDFERKKIKQPNLIKCFESIYGNINHLNKKTLMSKLREINNEFFKTEAIQNGTAGVKYFSIG